MPPIKRGGASCTASRRVSNPNVADWSAIRALPPGPPDSQDREPAALVGADGNIELFWSATRDGSWSIWRGTLNRATHTWGTLEPITSGPYTQRDPLPVAFAPGTLLIYRSNESLLYTSTVYGATETVDARYAGCTTVDTRNQAKIALRGRFEDFQTYTYDAGQSGQRTEPGLVRPGHRGIVSPARDCGASSQRRAASSRSPRS